MSLASTGFLRNLYRRRPARLDQRDAFLNKPVATRMTEFAPGACCIRLIWIENTSHVLGQVVGPPYRGNIHMSVTHPGVSSAPVRLPAFAISASPTSAIPGRGSDLRCRRRQARVHCPARIGGSPHFRTRSANRFGTAALGCADSSAAACLNL